MDGLPILVKPYYTIEETYERLKLAGAYLNDISDIYALAKEDMLKIELLLDGDYVLVNKNEAVPYLRTYFWHKIDLRPVIEILLGEEYMTDNWLGEQVNKFQRYELMFFREFLDNDISISLDYSDDLSDCIEPNIDNCISTYKQPLLVTPLSVLGAFNFLALRNTFYIDNEVFQKKEFREVDPLFAVQFEGETYFVCNWEEISEYTQPFTKHLIAVTGDGKRLSCPLWLNRNAIPDLLSNDKNKVVRTEAIKNFEEKYLGHSHTYDALYKERHKNTRTVQSQREQHLQNLIDEKGVDELKAMGRFEVWTMLSVIDRQSFPKRDDPEAAIIKSFFDNQNLIRFKKGRKG